MGNPWQKTINVTLTSVNPTEYQITPVGPDPIPVGADGALIFNNDNHNGFNIDFVLIDQTGQGYAFPPNNNKGQAVSSRLGAINDCPPQGTSVVLSPVNISGPNNNTLSVHNPNQGSVVGSFSYALWVTKDGGQSYVSIDPGGNNMNGAT